MIQNDQVDVTGDWSTGSVMVTAPANALPILAAFVADLDLQEDGVATLVMRRRASTSRSPRSARPSIPGIGWGHPHGPQGGRSRRALPVHPTGFDSGRGEALLQRC